MKHLLRERFPIGAAETERLRIFVAMLGRWTARINLIAAADLAAVWDRHVVDSAQLVDLLPRAALEFADLGSGAGFPGLVVAILTGRHAHLVESDCRKAAFLREAARETGTSATVHATRIEAVRLPPQPVVMARGLAPLPRLLAWAAPLLAPDGICLFPKGRTAERELTAAGAEWHMQVQRVPSRTDPAAVILSISEVQRAAPRT